MAVFRKITCKLQVKIIYMHVLSFQAAKFMLLKLSIVSPLFEKDPDDEHHTKK